MFAKAGVEAAILGWDLGKSIVCPVSTEGLAPKGGDSLPSSRSIRSFELVDSEKASTLAIVVPDWGE